MNRDQLKRLKVLEAENQRLRRAVSELTLDKMILAEASRGNFQALRAAGDASTMCGSRSECRSAAPAAHWGSTDPHSANGICSESRNDPTVRMRCGSFGPDRSFGAPQNAAPRFSEAAVHASRSNRINVRWLHGIFQSFSAIDPTRATGPMLAGSLTPNIADTPGKRAPLPPPYI